VTYEEYVHSPDFRRFLDETLHEAALSAATELATNSETSSKHQLHSINSVIKGAGLKGIRTLAESQKNKSTNEKNRAFWSKVSDIIQGDENKEHSLKKLLKSHLNGLGYLESEVGITKASSKAVRKMNSGKIDEFTNTIIEVYFEHFVCHYLYQKRISEAR
jgi:hypothetical protein